MRSTFFSGGIAVFSLAMLGWPPTSISHAASRLASPVPSVTMVTYSATGGPNASCVAPGQNQTDVILASDAAALVKITYQNWQGTHTRQTEWIEPNATVFAKSIKDTLTNVPNGAVSCKWIRIGGSPKIAKLGTWHVEELIDGQVAASHTFQIDTGNSKLVIDTAQTWREQNALTPNTCSGKGEIRSSAIQKTDKSVLTKVFVSVWYGQHTLSLQYMDPQGKAYKNPLFESKNSAGYGTWCAWIAVKGFPPASMPGPWTVDVRVDGSLVKTVPFTIS